MNDSDHPQGAADSGREKSPLDQMLHIERICTGFEKEWRNGSRRPLEVYLDSVDPLIHRALLAELLPLEIELRRAAGETPTRSEYIERLPMARELIETCLQGVDTAFDPGGRRTGNADSGLPRMFAHLELRGELGRGGMGVVYRALDTKLAREVAVKMVTAGAYSSPEVLSRFEREASAAASLDHHGIVPVFEFGRHQDRAFIVMALVRGPSLQERLAQGPFPPHPAATILRELAAAVNYAHSRAVIHRDLKPANVLLAAGDKPKLTDFGLAKIADVDMDLTTSGQLIGTPGYMAPEQAQGAKHVDERLDVYALGAILYAMLTARPPFQAATLPATLRQVLERDPVPPSQLNPEVPRELETICLRALQKDRAARFRSAEELGDELGRYLRGEPIHSRRISSLARLAKWARRNRLVAGLSAALITALIGGTVLSITLGLRAGRNARQAATEKRAAQQAALEEHEARVLADQEARRARTIRDYLLLDMLGAASPEGLGKDVSVRAVLDEAIERVGERFTEHPELEGAVRLVAAEAYLMLGDLEASHQQAELAHALNGRLYPEDHELVIRGQGLLARLLVLRSDSETALLLLREAYARASAKHGEKNDLTLEIELSLGECLQSSGDHANAQPHLRHVIDQARSEPGRTSLYFKALSSLAASLQATRKVVEAEALLRTWLEEAREYYGDEHITTAVAAGNLATLLQSNQNLEEASELHAYSISVLENVLTEGDWRIGFSKGRRGMCLLQMDCPEEARQELELCCTILARHFGESDFRTQVFVDALASSYERLGHLDLALARRERALLAGLGAAANTDLPRREFDRWLRACKQRGQQAPAEMHLRPLRALASKLEREERAHELVRLGRLAVELGHPALELLRRAADLAERLLGADHETTRAARQALAQMRSGK